MKFAEDKKIKILFYEPSNGFGGSASALARLVNNLDRVKFDPFIIIKNYGPQIEKIKNTEIIELGDYNEPEKISILRLFFYFIKNTLKRIENVYMELCKNITIDSF